MVAGRVELVYLMRYLDVDDLPNSLEVDNARVTISYLRVVVTHEIYENQLDFNRPSFTELNDGSNGIIFFINQNTMSIVWNSKYFFLFDSHSRDEQGKIIENGTAVLIKFSSLLQLQKYLYENYFSKVTERGTIIFQMQYVKTELNSVDSSSCLQSVSKKRKRQRDILKQTQPESHQQKFKLRWDNRTTENSQHQKMLKILRGKHANNKGTPEHKANLKQMREKMAATKLIQKSTMENRIKKFKKLVMEGPYYICIVCNRCLYKKTVVKFKDSYNNPDSSFYFSHVQSFDGCEYVCQTCHLKLKAKKNQIPCQAVCNKNKVFCLHHGLSDINRLVLVAKRLLFKKVVIMPKGNSPKIKGAICNVPIDTEGVCSVLPRPACSNGLLVLKLKPKLMYCGHVYFEPIRPQIVSQLLNFLKENNPLYSDVTVDLNQVSDELLYFDKANTPSLVSSENNIEENNTPLDEHETTSNNIKTAMKK